MNRLRELRKKRGLSLRELSKMLNMSFSNIATIERGESQLREDTARLFADFFGVTTDYLLGISDGPTPQIKIDQDNIQMALFGEVKDLSEEDIEDVLNYARYIKEKKAKNRNWYGGKNL